MYLPQQIPNPSPKRMAVRITADAGRQVRRGHPWIYDKAVNSISHEGAAGDLAVIFNKDRSFMAIGLYDPMSPIRIKVLQAGKRLQIDAGFWRNRFLAASDLRADLRDTVDVGGSALTTGYRCVNGENDGLPGVILDRYGATFVMKLYSSAWLPHLKQLIDATSEVFGPEVLILRLSRSVQKADTFGLVEGDVLVGQRPSAAVEFKEYGLTFEADVVAGQKTGHFLDQRENRNRIRALAKGADVLDLFSCTGGFSVHAAAGGARSVLSVDQSTGALATANANFEHNRRNPEVARCQHATREGDVFTILAALRRGGDRGSARADDTSSFDIVVVDPPSFAQKQSSVSAGLNSYRRLTEAAISLIRPGGLLFQASCSSRIDHNQFLGAVRAGAQAGGRSFEVVDESGHAVDHPVTFGQGAYLKAIFARVGS